MFGRTINLKLDKYQYSPEEKITGTVALGVSKSVKAKELLVSLIVIEKVNRVSGLGASVGRRGGSVRGSSSTSVREVFRFDLPLSGEREYSKDEEFPFSMQIPQQAMPSDIQSMQQEAGVLGKGLGMLASLSPIGDTTRIYKVQARLKVPWGFDTKATTDITIQK